MSIARVVPPALTYDQLQSLVPSRKEQLKRLNITSRIFPEISTQTVNATFQLPQSPNTFIVPGTMAICGTITFNGFSGGTAGTNGTAVIGSFYSMIQRQVSRFQNGVVMETIDNMGQLVHHLLNNTNDSSQQLSQSCMLGCTDAMTTGGSTEYVSALNSFGVAASAGANTFTFCLPLIGVLNTEKMIPLHSHGIEIEHTYAPLASWTRDLSGGAGTTATSYTLSNLEIIAETMILEEQSMGAILSMYPTIRLRSESWVYNATTPLSAQSGAGTYDLQLSSSLRGLKRVLWSCAPTNALDKGFAGVNPNLQNWQCIVGNKAFPQQPIEATRLAYCYLEAQKASGSIFTGDHCGSVSRRSYGVASTAYLGAAGEYRAYDAFTAAMPYNTMYSVAIYGNKWNGFLDTETLPNSHYMFSGVSTTGGQSLLRLNVASALANTTHNINVWLNYDVVVDFNMQDGSATITN